MEPPISLWLAALWFVVALIFGIVLGSSTLIYIQRNRRRHRLGRNTFIHKI